jgi:hypothetical protein
MPPRQQPIHRPDRRAMNAISTMKMARLNPTIHPTMATSHELAGNRLAHLMAIAAANRGNFRRQPEDNRNKCDKGEG